MAGSDWRPGDLSIEEQKRYLLQNIVSDVTVIVHEQDKLDAVMQNIQQHLLFFLMMHVITLKS